MPEVTLLTLPIRLTVQAAQVMERPPVQGQLTHRPLVQALHLLEQEVAQTIVERNHPVPVLQARKETREQLLVYIRPLHLTSEQ